jgi:cleavage and polyadenylation specificity factor subunit 2
MFNFTPLSGAQSESCASQSLLELDGGVKVLIDVGWDESFDVEKLRNLEKHVPTLSIVLLTHATVAHLAAYAHCCKHFPLFTRIPIYATTPVISLGRTLLQDLYASTPLASTVIPSSLLAETSYPYSKSGSAEDESHILLQPPTHEEIASYFSLIHPLKYSQPHQPLPSPFSPPLNGLTITAYNAGHTLGGTIWHIQHGLESIVYAVDWNQARENILAGAAWLGGAGAGGAEVIEQLRKPTALICSSRGAERIALAGGRTKRDELLLDMIKSAIVKGGTVLIPTDSSARVLELAYLLEHAWRKEASNTESPLRNAGLYLCSKNIGATMRYTRSMLEWMDDGIIREFEAIAGGVDKQQSKSSEPKQAKGAGPFDFKHLRLVEKKAQVSAILNNEATKDGKPIGKVILASDTSLDWGFSKDVLRSIATDNRSLIILTEKMTKLPDEKRSSGIARTLWSWWEERKDGVALEQGSTGENLEQVYGGGREIPILDVKRGALDGNELASYQQWLATQRQLQTTLPVGAGGVETSADAVDDVLSESSSDSEESETEQQGKALNISTALGHTGRKKMGLSDEDLGINILLRRKGVHDYDVRGKKGREKMFPLVIRRRRADDFGELIRPEEYLRAEERDETEAQDMRQPGKYDTKDTLGKKRKWEDVVTKSDRRLSTGGNKRQQISLNDARDIPDALISDTGFIHDVFEEDVFDTEPEEEIAGPSKAVFSTESVTLNLRLAFVDFAGLHDKRSLQMLIPLIQPRKLILVSGLKDETLALAIDCRKLLGAQISGGGDKQVDVYTPEIGSTVEASVDTNAWTVKLTHSLVKQLRWQKVKGLGIVTLTGRLAAIAPPTVEVVADREENISKKQKMEEEEVAGELKEDESKTIQTVPEPKKTAEPILDVVPTSMASATRSVAQPLHVGDLRLADLRKIMLSSGYTAEFRGEGTLLIDGCVAVRKLGTGRIEVESVGAAQNGAAPQHRNTFFAVKTKIYEGLAVVAGG